MRFIRKVFATKILLSGKFSLFVTLVDGDDNGGDKHDQGDDEKDDDTDFYGDEWVFATRAA